VLIVEMIVPDQSLPSPVTFMVNRVIPTPGLCSLIEAVKAWGPSRNQVALMPSPSQDTTVSRQQHGFESR